MELFLELRPQSGYRRIRGKANMYLQRRARTKNHRPFANVWCARRLVSRGSTWGCKWVPQVSSSGGTVCQPEMLFNMVCWRFWNSNKARFWGAGSLEAMRKRAKIDRIASQNWLKSSHEPPKSSPKPSQTSPRATPSRSRRHLGAHLGSMLYKSSISNASETILGLILDAQSLPREIQEPPKSCQNGPPNA